jgi:hypothetical protein
MSGLSAEAGMRWRRMRGMAGLMRCRRESCPTTEIKCQGGGGGGGGGGGKEFLGKKTQ